MITEQEKAYIAGIIDGEGGIGICVTTVKRKGKIYKYFAVNMEITNTNTDVLKWIKEKCKCGKLCIAKKHKTNFRQAFRLRFTSLETENILKQIYEYLIIKKCEADIIFEFRNTFNDEKMAGNKLTNKTILKRKFLYEELKKMHNKEFPIENEMIKG